MVTIYQLDHQADWHLEVFEKHNKLLTRTDVISVLEPYYKDKDLAALQLQVSSIMSVLKSDNLLKGIGSRKKMIWGLPYMFDDNGRPKQEYMK